MIIDFLIVDEIGPFELQGKGWAKAVSKIRHELDIPMLWVVRNQLVEDVINHFKIDNYQKFNIVQSEPITVANFIKKKILNR